MCGIVGVWRRDGSPVDVHAFARSTSRLRHRGPDDEGYLLVDTETSSCAVYAGKETSPALQLPTIDTGAGGRYDMAFGFRRLAILDLSPAGHQPMGTRDGRLWIVFNGEIYNYLELRSELAERGYTFHSDTDTEVVLSAYQEWGAECLGRFNGMWSFAIWDSLERTLFLARDRFGVKPLLYTVGGDTFAFASEAKALVGREGLPFAPDDEEIYRYLVFGTLPSPSGGQTFFRGLRSLPPAHWLCVSRDAIRCERYWSIPPSDVATGSRGGDVVRELASLFEDSVRLHLRSDVAVGTCLSGGLDSSSIVCTVNRLLKDGGNKAEQVGERQKTFSAVYESTERFNERPYVETVLDATGADGVLTFPTSDRLFQDLESLVWQQDQPFQSTSIFAQWCVMSAVREAGVTVLLDGQGADELLAGYQPYGVFLSDLITSGQIRRAAGEARRIAALTGRPTTAVFASGLVYSLMDVLRPHLPAGWAPILRRWRSGTGPGGAALDRDFAAQHQGSPVRSLPRAGSTFLDAILRESVMETSLPHLLHYEDRNSMAFSVEARVPFLDYRVVEFIFARCSPLRIQDGWTKWILRRAMEGTVPPQIVWRRDKVGFETPEAEWTWKWLRFHPGCFGDKAQTARYLDLPKVRALVEMGEKGRVDIRQLWRWINLELWLRVWSRA